MGNQYGTRALRSEQQQWSQQYDTSGAHAGVSDRVPVEEFVSCVLRVGPHIPLYCYSSFLVLWLTDDAIRIYSIMHASCALGVLV